MLCKIILCTKTTKAQLTWRRTAETHARLIQGTFRQIFFVKDHVDKE